MPAMMIVTVETINDENISVSPVLPNSDLLVQLQSQGSGVAVEVLRRAPETSQGTVPATAQVVAKGQLSPRPAT